MEETGRGLSILWHPHAKRVAVFRVCARSFTCSLQKLRFYIPADATQDSGWPRDVPFFYCQGNDRVPHSCCVVWHRLDLRVTCCS